MVVYLQMTTLDMLGGCSRTSCGTDELWLLVSVVCSLIEQLCFKATGYSVLFEFSFFYVISEKQNYTRRKKECVLC